MRSLAKAIGCAATAEGGNEFSQPGGIVNPVAAKQDGTVLADFNLQPRQVMVDKILQPRRGVDRGDA